MWLGREGWVLGPLPLALPVLSLLGRSPPGKRARKSKRGKAEERGRGREEGEKERGREEACGPSWGPLSGQNLEGLWADWHLWGCLLDGSTQRDRACPSSWAAINPQGDHLWASGLGAGTSFYLWRDLNHRRLNSRCSEGFMHHQGDTPRTNQNPPCRDPT